MASKSSSAERRSNEAEQDQLPVQTNEQMAAMTESASWLFKGVEAVQQVQQHAAQRAALRLQQAADQLRASDSPAQLLSVQSTLMFSGMQEMVQYVQDLTLIMLRVQGNMIQGADEGRQTSRAAVPGMGDSSNRAMHAATAAADATNAATMAVLQSWSNMMGAGQPNSDTRSRH